MGLIDDVLDGESWVFCDPDLMPGGESITYTPYQGSPKTINVNVFRRGPQLVQGLDRVVAPSVEIYVQNHATRGVTSINVNGDTVSIAERKGETPRTMTVNEILEQDSGMWHLSLA